MRRNSRRFRMGNEKLVSEIRRELRRHATEKQRKGAFYYFKEKIKPIGAKLPEVGRIAKEFDRKHYADLGLVSLLNLCSELQKGGWFEEQIIAGYLADFHRKEFTQETFGIFEGWVDDHVDNWANCDNLCNHAVAACVEKYPALLDELKKWTSSENRWKRRAAAVTLILPARHGKFLKEVLEIAERNIYDKDDMVQKGTGWLLREAAKKHEDEVFAFLLKHKDAGRTLLRYAVERFPGKRKKAVLV
ncbi:MAG: DNA alkylation repair protein [Candidatus Micrarchaeota archaeon]